MIDKVKRVLVGCAIVFFGTSCQMFAQDGLDADALLQDLKNGDKEDAEEAAVEVTVEEEQPAAPVQAGAAEAPIVIAGLPAEAGDADGAEDADAEDAEGLAKFLAGILTPEDDGLIAELAALEETRRKSLDYHGYQALEKARTLLQAGDNMGAADSYKQALEFIGKREANEAARQEAETGMAEAYYREARLLFKRYENESAKAKAEDALAMGHPQAAKLLGAINQAKDVRPPKSQEERATRLNEKAYLDRQDDIRRRLNKSRQYFMTKEFERALEECEIILRDHPGTVEAIELRGNIATRMNQVSEEERAATRKKMMQEVADAWTPRRYAINSAQTPRGKPEQTGRSPTGGRSDTKTASQVVNAKLRSIILPEVSFRPPATIIDAVDFFKQASRDYDNPEIPVEERGVNLILKLKNTTSADGAADDPFSGGGGASGIPVISAITARNISLFDALKLVCEVTGMKTRVMGNVVMIVPFDEADGELVRRSYNVLPSLTDKITSGSAELTPRNQGGGGAFNVTSIATDTVEDDWKRFFREMGVTWPTGSSISYALGKLRVTNTEDQLAIFEGILDELNVTEKLVEVEARFVEVSQEDLNSLGFEWLINGDYSFNAGGLAKNLLGLRNGISTVPRQLTDAGGNLLWADAQGSVPLMGYTPYTRPGYVTGNAWGYNGSGNLAPVAVAAGSYGQVPAPNHNMMMNAIDGQNFSTGHRYLTSATPERPVMGNTLPINDQFMRLNAFIGGADVSMILHMLSQKSDMDLLSAPKVTVSPDQEAVMKVVTEYIYPSEFNVQISQQGSSSGGYIGTTATPIAIVEPQNFTMREVGVILQVVPKLSEDGQMITLAMRPQVVSEPVWKNYGTKLPQTTYTESALFPGVAVPVTDYIELPMEQPFFNVRSVETQLTINNGATVVMGGLITETRMTVEDKIPLLGDIPFLGRLFRSRAEQTTKRNLLIFVTARTIDTAGRTIRAAGDSLVDSGTTVTPVEPQ